MNKEGKRLAEVVRRTHKRLRRQYKLGEDASQLWQEHTQHEEELHTYASAMHVLATQHWEARQQINTSRVSWIHGAIIQYFNEGEMQRTTEKEMRKLEHLSLKVDDPDKARGCKLPLTSKVKMLDVGSCYNPFLAFEELDVTAIDLCPAHPSVKKCDFLRLEVCIGGKSEPDTSNNSEVLSESDEYEATDLLSSSPSSVPNSEVIVSDASNGLQLESRVELACSSMSDENKIRVNTVDDKSILTDILGDCARNSTGMLCKNKDLQDIKHESLIDFTTSSEISLNTITVLEGGSYDVVVFCLLLEYIPSPKQRFLCCQKAYDLLKPNGILCIITPDSKHQNANVHLYKLWKITLGFLGFARTKYEKLTHFHGMVFRKGLCKGAWELDATRELSLMKNTNVKKKFDGIDHDKVSSEMYIPQDFQELSDSEEVPEDERGKSG
nr:S-adenosylmethionine sensor upstream of mTORC1-like [Procambarus clarkii]